jgi:signal transduction histidine kinase
VPSGSLNPLAAARLGSEATGAGQAELLGRIDRMRSDHEQLLIALAEHERRFRSLARRVWSVEEEQRRRIALELHDGLGQTLTALVIELELMAGVGAASSDRLAVAARIASEALASTRELSRLLRPSLLDDLGLVPALRWLARSLGEGTGFQVEIDLPDADRRLPAEAETLLFRVAQEALTNALKHSGAQGARLELGYEDRSARLVVRDDGRGFEAESALAGEEPARGLGLRNLRDRVELHGGRWSIDSSPGRGTRVEVVLPLEEGER